jgi:hypothetical protein
VSTECAEEVQHEAAGGEGAQQRTTNPASSPGEPATSNVPSTGIHERGTRFTSAWVFGWS